MYVPPKIVTNHDLEKMMDTSDDWIRERSGIRERRHSEDGVGASDLALYAANQALESAGVSPQEIDLIICATLSPDVYFPGISVLLQDKLGLDSTPSMDLRCQCSGFIYALNVASNFIACGQYKKVLLVGAENQSKALDLTTRGRDVSVLFGDGAGAVVLTASDRENEGVLDFELHSEGKYADKLWLQFPSMTVSPIISADNIEQGLHFPRMEGRFVYKHAVTRLEEVITSLLNKHSLRVEDVPLFLFHQANANINMKVAEKMGIKDEQIYSNIDKYGNCSAASIPMCLDEAVRLNRVKSGDLICMAAFGSGFTWASALARW